MNHFLLLNKPYKDTINFYRTHPKQQTFVKMIQVRSYFDEYSALQFKEDISKQLPRPARFVGPVYEQCVHAPYHAAIWELPEPKQTDCETFMLHLFHLFQAATSQMDEIEVLLVAYHQDDAHMEHPYYLYPIRSFHNTWRARRATVSAKVDSFEGIRIQDVPEDLRQVWIGNIKKALRRTDPKPAFVKEADNHLEVTWHFTGATETNDMMRSVFWLPGHRDMIPNEFSRYYDLHDKEDFEGLLDKLLNESWAGDSNG